MLTGTKNSDFLILNELNNHDLGRVCQVNKMAKSLCDDDNFWNQRLHHQITSLDFFERSRTKVPFSRISEVKTFLKFDKWKDFYKFLFSNVQLLMSKFNRDEDSDIDEIIFLMNEFEKNIKIYEDFYENINKVKLPFFIDKNKLLI